MNGLKNVNSIKVEKKQWYLKLYLKFKIFFLIFTNIFFIFYNEDLRIDFVFTKMISKSELKQKMFVRVKNNLQFYEGLYIKLKGMWLDILAKQRVDEIP